MTSAAISGTRRPKRSLSGPISSWPSASPVTHAVSVSWTTEALAPNSRASSGKAGRYMSIDSGPIAITDPSTITSPAVDELRTGSAAPRHRVGPAVDGRGRFVRRGHTAELR